MPESISDPTKIKKYSNSFREKIQGSSNIKKSISWDDSTTKTMKNIVIKKVLSWVDKTTKELAQPIIPNVDTVMRRTPSTYKSINFHNQ